MGFFLMLHGLPRATQLAESGLSAWSLTEMAPFKSVKPSASLGIKEAAILGTGNRGSVPDGTAIAIIATVRTISTEDVSPRILY